MAVQFVCPWCAQDISADETKAGTTVECPNCNHYAKVPAKSTHEPPSPPPSSPRSADTPASGFDSAVSEPPLPPASPPQPARVPLKRRAILKAAIKERQAGKPAEEVYKTYQGQVRPNNALAMAIASVADPERKRRYAVLNYVLVALLVLVAVLKALSVVMFSNLSPGLTVGAVVLGLFVPLGFAFVIARFDGRMYSFLILLLLLNALNILFGKGNWLLKLPDLVLLAAIIAVAFVAQRKIFPNMRLFRVKKSTDGSYVWIQSRNQERRFAEATLRGMPPPVTARQGIPVSNRSRFLVILILIALVLFVGVSIRFGSGSKVTLAPTKQLDQLFQTQEQGMKRFVFTRWVQAVLVNKDPSQIRLLTRQDLQETRERCREARENEEQIVKVLAQAESKGTDLSAFSDAPAAIQPETWRVAARAMDAADKYLGLIDQHWNEWLADPLFERPIEPKSWQEEVLQLKETAQASSRQLHAIVEPERAASPPPSPAVSGSPARGFNAFAALNNANKLLLKMHVSQAISNYKHASERSRQNRWIKSLEDSSYDPQKITRTDLHDGNEKLRELIASVDRVIADLNAVTAVPVPDSEREYWQVTREHALLFQQLTTLLEENWKEWHVSGIQPKTGEAKPWQKEADRLHGEIDKLNQTKLSSTLL